MKFGEKDTSYRAAGGEAGIRQLVARFYDLMDELPDARAIRAMHPADLAESLEVSERTIYRDIRDLMASGVPIEGEAGVGYILHDGFDLPPLMFKEEEIEDSMAALRSAAGFLRQQLSQSLNQRGTPKLVFEHDTSIKEGIALSKLIDSVQ